MSELTLKVVVPSFDGSQPLTPAVLNGLLSGIAISLEGLAGSASISDGAVTTAKLADHAVTPVKLHSSVAGGGGLSLDDTNGLGIPTDGIVPARVKYPPVVLGTSGSVVIDWSAGFTFSSVLTGNITFDFTGQRDGQRILLAVTQAAAGSKTVSWTPTIKWRAGVPPVMTATANKTDLFALLRIGSAWYGNYSQNY